MFSKKIIAKSRQMYHVSKVVQAVVGNITIVGVLTRALLHTICDIKAARMNSLV